MYRLNKLYLAPVIITLMLLLSAAQIRAAPKADLYFPFLLGSGNTVDAAGQGLPWTNHAAPFDFKFGNHKDQHQQSMVVPASPADSLIGEASSGGSKLIGFLYITYTDSTGQVPQAQHVACAPEVDCRVGWLMHGVNAQATLVAKGQGRPQYCVDAVMQPLLDKGFTHFHWVKGQGACLHEGNVYDGYLIRLTAQGRFEFFHSGNDGNHGGSGGGCGEDEDGCSGDEGGCGEDEDSCSGDESGCSGDEGAGHDEPGGHDDPGGHGGPGGHGEGIMISPGPDWESHRNVTVCSTAE